MGAAPHGADGSTRVCGGVPQRRPRPYGPLQNGIGVVDRVKVYGAAPDGSYAEWRFAAPSGTAVVGASITRDIGNRDEWTPYGRIDGVDQAGESCLPGIGEAFCRIQGTRTFAGLNASTIAYGIRCVVAPYCAHGATLRTVWALVLSATVTLDDRQAPTVSAVDATGLADGQWWNRAGGVSFSGQDNTGIRRRAVVVGGVVRAVVEAPAAASGGCRDVGLGEAYSYVRPCADGRGLNGARTVSVDPCSWGDGVHSVRGRVTDTGGLEAVSSTAATVRVDCSAPDIAVGSAAPAVVEGEPVEPSVTASDSRSGLSRTEVEVRVDGGSWRAHDALLPAVAGRTYAFRARAVDVAGNWTAWRQTDVTWGVARPAQPTTEIPRPPVTPADPAGVVEPSGALDAPLADDAAPVDRLAEHVPETLASAPARLRITRVRTSASRVIEIRGVADRALVATVTVTIRAGRRGHHRRAPVANGVWRARIRTAAKARVIDVRATTPATATYAAGAARWRVPRTKAAAALAHDPVK
jgi:hypothetical protein